MPWTVLTPVKGRRGYHVAWSKSLQIRIPEIRSQCRKGLRCGKHGFLSLLQLSHSFLTFLAQASVICAIRLHPGLALPNRLKEKTPTLTVLFVYSVFKEWSQICVQFLVRNHREAWRQVQYQHVDLQGSAKHLVFSVFFSFCLRLCVYWDGVW